MNKRAIISTGVAIGIALAIPGIAQAHNATATPSCTGLAWSATNYNKDVVNTIVVKVDGVTVHQDLDFKASDTGTHPWSQTAPHTWGVTINAPGTEFDRSFSGTWQACQTAPTTTAPTSTTVGTTTTTASTDTSPLPTVVTTTTQVAVGIPPVPPTTLAPAGRGEPICEPDMPCWPCRDFPGYVCPVSDLSTLTPADPVLPATGLDGTIIVVAIGFLIVGTYLVVRGRRVP